MTASAEPTLPEIDVATLAALLDSGQALLIDVREEEEWEEAHLPQAHLLPLSDFDVDDMPAAEGRTVVIMCRSGYRSAAIARKLLRDGYGESFNLTGGILAWQAAGYAVATGEAAAARAAA